MSDERLLTPEQLEAAVLLRRAWKASGKTQEKIGAEVGVSQGRVGHWMNARDPVPLDKAEILAQVLGIDDPADICPAWRAIMGRYRGRAAAWPFQLNPSRWERLAPEEKVQIEQMVTGMVMAFEAKRFGTEEREDRLRRHSEDDDLPQRVNED